MSINKYLVIIVLTVFGLQMGFSQGCEDAGEGDGINFFGYIQPTYEYKILGENGTFTKNADESGFYFKRARLGVLGNIPYDFSYYFMMEFSPERGVGINDAFLTYNRFSPYVKASVGLFKAPFSSEQVQGCHKLHTIHRSRVVNELAGPIRDMGVMLSGGIDSLFGLKIKNLVQYQFAFLNGEGRNILDSDNRKAMVGRLVLHPAKLITFGTSYKYGRKPPSTNTTEDDDYFTRLGFDLKLEYKKFTLIGEFIKGSDFGSFTTGGGCSGEPVETHVGSVDRQGYYAMLLYKTKWDLEPVVKYETFDSNMDLEGTIENTWTIGFNYFFNEWTRLQINYNYNFEENINVEVPNDAILIQLQAIIK